MLTRSFVEAHLIAFEPERVLPTLAETVKDIYENRYFIKMAPPTDFVVHWLAGRILEAVNSKKRFRRIDCLTVLRVVMRNEHRTRLSAETVDLLFELYRHFIFTAKEDIQWRLSTFLKDQLLRDQQVQWLIENAERSEHLLNRLLRYPEKHEAITKWAAQSLKSEFYSDRKTELFACLITDVIPGETYGCSAESIMWAVHYSHAPSEGKEEMILSQITLSSMEPALKVAIRLKLPNIIKYIAGLVADDAV